MSSRDDILSRLDTLGISYERHTHPEISTAADRFPMGLTYDAQVCKNLLVSTRNESCFLLVMLPYDKTVDLKGLRDAMGTSRLQFAPQNRLQELLEQQQGCVGVCGVIHDGAHHIQVVFDQALRDKARIAMHPGDNRETIVLSFSDLERYVHSCGNPVFFYDFHGETPS